MKAQETVIFGRTQPCDRDEEEIRGYRDALKLIHEQGIELSLTSELILQLHNLSRGTIWDAGKFKNVREIESLGRSPRAKWQKRGNNKGNVHNSAFAFTCFCFFAAE